MKKRWFFSFTFAAFTWFSAIRCLRADTPIVVNFPEPPQQRAKWNPSTNSIPPELLSATKILFDQGLADPRGCEYREIEVRVGNVWTGDGGIVKTHGWVLPNTTGTNGTFAICWNGLVTPAASVGGKTDLSKDIEPMIAGAASNIWHSSLNFNPYSRSAIPEKAAVACDTVLPGKACLLLRLGEYDLANRLWTACDTFPEDWKVQRPEKGPYLMLASDWAWFLFDRAICAHMRGDVSLALNSTRKLSYIQRGIEAEAAELGFARPMFDNPPPKNGAPYLSFLDQLPQLLDDLERRAQSPEAQNVMEVGLTNFPNQQERIAALIQDLDMMNGRQMGQPGWVLVQRDKIVWALINEGDPAVEPLLKCAETDKRLTRSVGFWRDFSRKRTVLSVAGVAMVALEEILHMRAHSVAEIRAYWEKNKGLTLEDRWYATLQDDRAGIHRWLEAAKNIVQPTNVYGVPGGALTLTTPSNPARSNQIRGEVLRSKSSPSITDLLLMRANQVAADAAKKDQFMGVDGVGSGTDLCEVLAKWDKPAAAVVPARSLMEYSLALWSDNNSFIMSSGHDLARFIPRLTQMRAMGGDTNALAEYADWIRSADPQKIDFYIREAFDPLNKNRGDKSVAAAAEWLFNNPASPWSKWPWKNPGLYNPLQSDLVKLPAFKKFLARELDKKDVIGSIELTRTNYVTYEITDLGRGSFTIDIPDSSQTPLGTKTELRECDWIALKLAEQKHLPPFSPFWSMAARDSAIQVAKKEFLKPE